MREGGLEGCAVLVTRPARQASHLAAVLDGAGARTVLLPAIEIEPAASVDLLRSRLIAALGGASVALFVSVNAVESVIQTLGSPPVALQGLALGAVGAATARSLESAGLPVSIRPAGRFDSESLLTLPALGADALGSGRVVIVKGEGGRPHLRETLEARGVQVVEVSVYRRVCPPAAAPEVREVLARGGLDAVVATSAEAVDNLCLMFGERQLPALLDLAWVTVSERVAEHALARGVREVVVAERAADEALLDALVGWWRERPGRA